MSKADKKDFKKEAKKLKKGLEKKYEKKAKKLEKKAKKKLEELMYCNGCSKHCSLSSPKCGKGRKKAEKLFR